MLTLRDVKWAAPDGDAVLRGINLEIPDHKLVVVTGPNGGGKTTLAKMIVGLEKPDSGAIELDGKDITNLNITERARLGISFAFQQPVRFKGLTVMDLLELAAGGKIQKAEACEYLSRVGLCAREYIDREVNATLSGGEIKRIELATVLARHTRLSIFDEPEAGIDLWSFNNLIEVFQDLQKTLNGSMVIISHQERILAIADEIIVIAGGRVTAQGPAQEIMGKLLSGEKSCDICPKQEVRYGGECHE
ncbi:MAG: ABC transporter ATP-binding protein [Candidatus Spyradocola sp.]